jgi:hypothetical protein
LFPFVIVVHCFLSSTFLYTAILSFCTMFPFVIVVHCFPLKIQYAVSYCHFQTLYAVFIIY